MTDGPRLVEISQADLPDEAILAIGRIVRVCAELEDNLDLWICNLAKIDQAKTAVILGRSNVSTKINIALGLANLRGTKYVRLHTTAFDENITKLTSCRNATAHGRYVGQDEEGHFIFVTSNNVGYEGINLQRRADGYLLSTLQEIARAAAERVAAMPDLLGLRSLRERRWQQHLPVIQADQPKGKQGAKRKPPRSTSRR